MFDRASLPFAQSALGKSDALRMTICFFLQTFTARPFVPLGKLKSCPPVAAQAESLCHSLYFSFPPACVTIM